MKCDKQTDGFDYEPTNEEICRALAVIIYRRYFKYAATNLYREYALDMLERFIWNTDLEDFLTEYFDCQLHDYFADKIFRERRG